MEPATRAMKDGKRLASLSYRVTIRRNGFLRDHQNEFRVVTMCRVLKVERRGFYGCLAKPRSARALDDARVLKPIEETWLTSGGVGHEMLAMLKR